MRTGSAGLDDPADVEDFGQSLAVGAGGLLSSVTKSVSPEVDLKRAGERGRNRTFNLLIKSQLLCQLSYAPFKD